LHRDSLGQDVNKGRLIPVGDHHIRLLKEGAESPVVVIIAGAGDCADPWLPIRHRLAAAPRVVSYDRAAIGDSDEALGNCAHGAQSLRRTTLCHDPIQARRLRSIKRPDPPALLVRAAAGLAEAKEIGRSCSGRLESMVNSLA
jgi:pimeloyl-ACP methyl ester carboxylesterase